MVNQLWVEKIASSSRRGDKKKFITYLSDDYADNCAENKFSQHVGARVVLLFANGKLKRYDLL